MGPLGRALAVLSKHHSIVYRRLSLPTEGQAAAVDSSQEEKEAIEKGMRDVTELDNPGFRYIL